MTSCWFSLSTLGQMLWYFVTSMTILPVIREKCVLVFVVLMITIFSVLSDNLSYTLSSNRIQKSALLDLLIIICPSPPNPILWEFTDVKCVLCCTDNINIAIRSKITTVSASQSRVLLREQLSKGWEEESFNVINKGTTSNFVCALLVNTVIPRLTNIIRCGITFVSRNLR